MFEGELARVVRSRVIHPKWIDGMTRDGYKGTFEIAASVDDLFAFAATTGAAKSHHFDLARTTFVENREPPDFIARYDPPALKEIGARLTEAAERGLWRPRSNSARALLEKIT